jgi:hypothetical protein
MGFMSNRVADFAVGSPDLTHPPPLPGLGTRYVETTQESLPVNLGGVSIKKGKSAFLTIQLYVKFGFGHRTSKPDIFDHPTVKPFKFSHQAVLMGGFQFFYLQFSPYILK